MEEELRLGRRTSEATGACLVRQRLTSREHSPVRQYGFISRLPRYKMGYPALLTVQRTVERRRGAGPCQALAAEAEDDKAL
jgi:hypothetical protein